MKRFSILLPVFVCLLLIVISGSSLFRAAINNAWSLNYAHYATRQTPSLRPAPEQHLRATLWLALDALTHNDPVRAQTLISKIANNESKEALFALLGDSYAAQDQFGAAVTAWAQAGAYNSLIAAASKASGANRPNDAILALEAAFSINAEKVASPLVALLLVSKDEPEKSMTLLRDVIQRYPNSVDQADWNYLMGRLYTKEKQYDEADIWFARAIALNPKSQWYWIWQANSARDNGKLARALDLYIQAARQFPDFAEIYYEIAWAYHLAGLTREAIQSIEKAIQLMNPPNVWYEVRAGQLYVDNSRLDDALKAFLSAQSIDPGVGTTYLTSFYQNTLKDTDEAISALQQAIANYQSVNQRISWILQLAGIYRDAKLWTEAEAMYKEILTKDPANMDAHIGLGWVYYSNSVDFHAAQAEFQKAINAAPERGEGYFAMGQLLVKEKRYAEADPWFAQAIERVPDNESVWIERGNALQSAGAIDEAIQIYNQGIDRFSNFSRGYYELSWAYRLKDNQDLSIFAIEKALEIATTQDEWYFVRAGLLYEWVESKGKAIIAFREALKINPINSSALDGLKRLEQ